MEDTTVNNSLRFTEKDYHLFSVPADKAALRLLGKVLCHRLPDGNTLHIRITETEAYSHEDKVCYGYGKEPTEATSPLFQKGGTCCIYGAMLLIACGQEGEPDNVLLRCGADESGHVFNGPNLLYNGLQLNKDVAHGINLLTSDNLWLEGVDEVKEYRQTKRVRTSDDGQNSFILL